MLYVYQCKICSYKIEKSHSIKDEPFNNLFCTRCRQKTPVKRLICGGAFILKGSGWAKDGYHKVK
ncbi:MAG: FmdB family transcriptional regulator [Deltaproteobacteria bacterium]|nr:MAG: FmdB family transcriptional regulator [Deltaproteobacteria bacterium]